MDLKAQQSHKALAPHTASAEAVHSIIPEHTAHTHSPSTISAFVLASTEHKGSQGSELCLPLCCLPPTLSQMLR